MKDMLKKYLSGMLAISMGMTMIPHNSLAAEILNMESFNATKSAVILNFSSLEDKSDINIPTDKAKDFIVLEKHTSDGKITRISDYDIKIQDKQWSNVENANSSVVIKPKDGLSEDALYRVTVNAEVKNFEVKANTGWFGIDVIFSDDFNAEGKYVKGGDTTYPYYWDSTGTYLLSKYWKGSNDTRVQIGNTTQKHNYTDYNVMRFLEDSSVYISDEAISADKTTSDYTVEYQYQYPGYANGGSHWFSMRGSRDDLFYNRRKGYYVQLRNDTAMMGKLSAPIKLYAAGTNIATSEEYVPDDSGLVNIRMSTIDDNIQYYIDENKIFDVKNKSFTSSGDTVFFDKNSTQWWEPSYIDNVYVTQLVKYGDDLPEIKVTNSSISGSTAIIELSQEIKCENIESFIELKNDEGATYQVDVEQIGTFLGITPKAALADGKYILTLKEGIYAANSAVLQDPYQMYFEVSDGNMQMIQITKPEISNINAEVLNCKFKMTYDYTGENANNSKYIIYSSKTVNGDFEEIKNGRLTGEELEFDTDESYVDCYLKIKISPEDSKGYLNDSFYTDVFKGMFTPVIKDVVIEDNFEGGNVKISDYVFYDENGDADLTQIQWYASDEADGEYIPIENATQRELIIDDSLRDKFIKVYITPKTDVYPQKGETYISNYFCRIYEPEARNVKIIGEAAIGAILTGEYTYYDKNHSEENGTTYRWLVSDSKDGEYAEIEGFEGREFTITEEYNEKFVKFEVTPKKEGVAGAAVLSEAFALPAKPVAKNVEIRGTVKPGYTVTGVYEFYQVNNVSEGDSEFTWYVDSKAVSHEKMYTILRSDAGKELCFEVKPIAKREPSEGEPSKSKTVKIGTVSSSGGSSGGGSKPSGGSGIIIGQVKNDTENASKNNNEIITKFTDISESPYKKEIAILTDKKIINGVSETEFRPNRNITRAEFTALMMRQLGMGEGKYSGAFDDVASDMWFAGYVQTAYESGIVEGYAGLFRPQDDISIEEILKVLIESYEKKTAIEQYSENKVHDVSDWAKEYAQKSAEIGLITDKEFDLREKSSREIAAALIYRYIEKAGEK